MSAWNGDKFLDLSRRFEDNFFSINAAVLGRAANQFTCNPRPQRRGPAFVLNGSRSGVVNDEMCGIAGIVCRAGDTPDVRVLDRMIGAIEHRGPDARGTYVDREAGLGHARLSIIDISGGGQPMHNADRSLSIVFNGEIFNYLELRERLQGEGVRFATRSDTEVILHSYALRGADCVHDFNGQWAFAIWDARRRELFLSRDRLGIRPLYYTTADGALAFASEIKAIFQQPGVSRELDVKGLDQVFTFWHTVGERTVFKGIRELPPGCSMTFKDGQTRTRRYWRLDYGEDGERLSDEDCAERLRELLIDATRLRLRADVPVGAYLSGGLDSSVTTALIKGFTDTPVKTFSVSFAEREFDESAFQAEVIRHLGTDHHIAHCENDDIGEAFPDVIWHTEKPVVRTAPAPLFRLSRLVREHGYKVVLTGEGADEALGGYDIFKEDKIRRFWAVEPESRRRPMLLKKLYPYMDNIQALPAAYLKGFFRIRREDLASPFFSHLPRWELTGRLKLLFSREVRAELEGYDAYEDFRELLPADFHGWAPLSRAQYLEATGLMPGYILSSQGDRMLMSHSVEGRFPFLDHRVVEFAGRMRPRVKMRGLDEKHVLKLAARDLAPRSVLERPKQPYRAPDARSFYPGAGRAARQGYVRELLSREAIEDYGVFHAPAVEQLVRKVSEQEQAGVRDNMGLVAVMSTQLVMNQLVHHLKRY